MTMDYLDIANGSLLFILCALTIGVVAIQSIFLFLLPGEEVKKLV